jgi:hypothetical protein
MLLSPHVQEALCGLSIFWALGIGTLLLIAFGGYRIFKRRGILSSLFFVAGILVGLAIPIQEIGSWIFFGGGRGPLPWVNIVIGLVLVAASLLIPSQKKPENNWEDQAPTQTPDQEI